MTAAQLTDAYPQAPRASGIDVTEAGLDVRLEIHDASRLEWSVVLPLPAKGNLAYTIDVELEIPSNRFTRHTPWDQLQSFTRLDGGEIKAPADEAITIDALRRGAVAVAHRIARAGEGFSRHCLVSASLFTRRTDDDLEGMLASWLECGILLAEDARKKLAGRRSTDAVEIARERALVDEYVSLRVLEMLAGAERGLEVLKGSRAPQAAEYAEAVARIESKIADYVERETEYRSRRGYVCPDPKSRHALEQYIERASRLKKHFQEVLFLEPDVYQVAERLHHWVAAFVALVASTWAFVWQLALMNRGPNAGATVSSGIVVFAIVAGIIYATKDRLKELGRTWISGNVHRFYAQRVARYRVPSRSLPGRNVVASARESFEQKVRERPDPLNPESGARVPHTIVRYTHRGRVASLPALVASGTGSLKHVFRYDLSPLFTRLDDPVKQVPVLDKATHRVCFTAAPRCYRFPIRVSVCSGNERHEERGVVVMHKGGLDRLERESDLSRAISEETLAGLES